MIKKTIASLLILLILSGCTQKYPLQETCQTISPSNKQMKINATDKQIWDKTVAVYLQDQLWTEDEAYDAGHCLMVPLHAAFYSNNNEWQQQFSRHFSCFMKAEEENPEIIVDGRLNKLHYLYLASQFVVLAEQYGKSNLIPQGLVDLLYNEVNSIWLEEPAWQWDRSPFNGGMRERVLWKLNHKNVSYSYYRAIIDEELFTFAITADLRTYEKLEKPFSQWLPVLTDVLKTAYRVFRQEGKYQSGGGWLFQPGVWTDHPDYAYVGYIKEPLGKEPNPLSNIAWDTSHSHRFPLWISSLTNAYQDEQPEKYFYANIKEGLEQQFFSKVLVGPSDEFPAYRTKNFMDGNNGFFRFNSSTTEIGGYGPYKLSGTLSLGWWTFLGTNRIQKVYNKLSQTYPLPPEVISVYIGPNTIRDRNPYVRWPDFFTNGFSELIARLASKLPSR